MFRKDEADRGAALLRSAQAAIRDLSEELHTMARDECWVSSTQLQEQAAKLAEAATQVYLATNAYHVALGQLRDVADAVGVDLPQQLPLVVRTLTDALKSTQARCASLEAWAARQGMGVPHDDAGTDWEMGSRLPLGERLKDTYKEFIADLSVKKRGRR